MTETHDFEMPIIIEVKKPYVDRKVLNNELWKWQIKNKILVLFNKRDGYSGYWCPDVDGVETWRVTSTFKSIDDCNDWMREASNQEKIMAAVVAVTAATCIMG